MPSDFYFLVPESFHKNLVQIGTVVFEKIRFEFLYVNDLRPRSRNDLDLQYSHTFIYSIRCLLLLTLKSLAAIVSVKVTPGSSFEQTMMGWSPRCYIPSFVKIGLPVLEKKIFEGFLPYIGVAAILVM